MAIIDFGTVFFTFADCFDLIPFCMLCSIPTLL